VLSGCSAEHAALLTSGFSLRLWKPPRVLATSGQSLQGGDPDRPSRLVVTYPWKRTVLAT
jgi:hypothetical protein